MPKNQRTAQKKARALTNSARIPYSMALRLAQGAEGAQPQVQRAESPRRPAARALFPSFGEQVAKSLGSTSRISAAIKAPRIPSLGEEVAKSLGTSFRASVLKASRTPSFGEEVAKSLGSTSRISAAIKAPRIPSLGEEVAKSL
ncbi:hypothetical protein ACIP4X_26835, partial [Streptomyces sp. NPDC088817]|uniref:hypothetical protein n=1 Tax=Streptomyces sp. NPDC088817 TaxID=3365907 RepID=UPI003815C3A3